MDSITLRGSEKSLKENKKGKATGSNDITVEAWKVIGKTGVDILLQIFNMIMKKEKMACKWRNSRLIPTFENNSPTQDCDKYRGMKLMSHTCKM